MFAPATFCMSPKLRVVTQQLLTNRGEQVLNVKCDSGSAHIVVSCQHNGDHCILTADHHVIRSRSSQATVESASQQKWLM